MRMLPVDICRSCLIYILFLWFDLRRVPYASPVRFPDFDAPNRFLGFAYSRPQACNCRVTASDTASSPPGPIAAASSW